MLFWLKKSVAFWLMPLPLCLTLMTAGLVLTRHERRRRLGRILLTTGLALLIAFSNKTVSRWLIAPLEAVYPPIPELAQSSPVPAGSPPAAMSRCSAADMATCPDCRPRTS